MVVGSGNDFSTKRMVSRDIDSAIIPDESVIHFHAAVVIEGSGNGVIPEVNVSGGCFYASMGFFNGRHDHGFEMFWGQDYYLVIVVLSLVVVCSSRKKVCFLVRGTGFVMKGKMVFCQLGDPSSLSSIYFLRFLEILEVLMICPNLEVLECPHEIVPPLFEGEHDGKEFFVVDLIVTFCN